MRALNREATSFDSFQTDAVWNCSNLLIFHENSLDLGGLTDYELAMHAFATQCPEGGI